MNDGLKLFDSKNGENAKVVNLTPHEIVWYSLNKKHILGTFPPSGIEARVEERTSPCGLLKFMPLVTKKYGEIENLPPQTNNEETIYLVSAMVKNLVKSRNDVLAPDTGAVRDEKGKLIGTTQFIYF